MRRINVISIAVLILFLLFRNQIRLMVSKPYAVSNSNIKKIKTINEGVFVVNIFSAERNFKNKCIKIYNNLFDDYILCIALPIKKVHFKNILLKPKGTDRIDNHAILYFNTLFFNKNFDATTGMIDNTKIIDTKPSKKRLGIDKQGKIIAFSKKNNNKYKDVLQVPFTFKQQTKPKLNFKNLNYRQFISIKNDSLYYISGHGNSLISWVDIIEIMKIKQIEEIIPMDGGASLDYYFQGNKNVKSGAC